jgi:hypothetical protein
MLVNYCSIVCCFYLPPFQGNYHGNLVLKYRMMVLLWNGSKKSFITLALYKQPKKCKISS